MGRPKRPAYVAPDYGKWLRKDVEKGKRKKKWTQRGKSEKKEKKKIEKRNRRMSGLEWN